MSKFTENYFVSAVDLIKMFLFQDFCHPCKTTLFFYRKNLEKKNSRSERYPGACDTNRAVNGRCCLFTNRLFFFFRSHCLLFSSILKNNRKSYLSPGCMRQSVSAVCLFQARLKISAVRNAINGENKLILSDACENFM